MKTLAQQRVLTELDHVRLTKLLDRGAAASVARDRLAEIEDILDVAELVAPGEIDPDCITMNSEVLLRDVETAEATTITLCYPSDSRPADGAVSVLSPLGTSLLGMRRGDIARWTCPTGAPRAAEVVAVLFQPESVGDFTR